jgi:di/tricarboxylate transporter
MLLFLVIEPHEISKLFALGLLWCCVGMFFNSQALIKVTNIIERIGGKLGKK